MCNDKQLYKRLNFGATIRPISNARHELGIRFLPQYSLPSIVCHTCCILCYTTTNVYSNKVCVKFVDTTPSLQLFFIILLAYTFGFKIYRLPFTRIKRSLSTDFGVNASRKFSVPIALIHL